MGITVDLPAAQAAAVADTIFYRAFNSFEIPSKLSLAPLRTIVQALAHFTFATRLSYVAALLGLAIAELLQFPAIIRRMVNMRFIASALVMILMAGANDLH